VPTFPVIPGARGAPKDQAARAYPDESFSGAAAVALCSHARCRGSPRGCGAKRFYGARPGASSRVFDWFVVGSVHPSLHIVLINLKRMNMSYIVLKKDVSWSRCYSILDIPLCQPGREKLYWVPFFEIWQKIKNAAAKKSALYHSN
jgi:hypothetical protein